MVEKSKRFNSLQPNPYVLQKNMHLRCIGLVLRLQLDWVADSLSEEQGWSKRSRLSSGVAGDVRPTQQTLGHIRSHERWGERLRDLGNGYKLLARR